MDFLAILVERINMEKRRMCLIDWVTFFFFVQIFDGDFVGSVENKKNPLRMRGAGLSYKRKLKNI